MDNSFWTERWTKREIGFHQRSINTYLQQHWPTLGVASGVPVFVPLCGKSLDMHWLRERGHPVIGVEIARTAVAEFFAEWGVIPRVSQEGAFEHWRAEGIDLLCGDFFALSPSDLAGAGAVFDRAALIALPPALRQTYAMKLREILPTGTPILLITADYAQQEMSGPPFAVGGVEVRTLFADASIELLAEVDVSDLPDNARFRQRGLSRLIERTYLIR